MLATLTQTHHAHATTQCGLCLVVSYVTGVTKEQWTLALFVSHKLPIDGVGDLESKTIHHLVAEEQLLKSQVGLFIDTPVSPHVDIVTKEALPGSLAQAQLQNRELRQCLLCSSSSATWLSRPGTGGVLTGGLMMPSVGSSEDLGSRWLEQWHDHCICGGLWHHG